MRKLIAIVSIISVIIAASVELYAQDDALIRYPVEVERATLTTTVGGDLAVTVIGNETLSCDTPMMIEQQYDGGTLVIDIYEEATAAVACIAMIVPYEATIVLEVPDGETPQQVIVNGVIAAESDYRDIQLPTTPDNGVSYHQVESVEMVEGEDGWELLVRGVQPDRCLLPVTIEQEIVNADWLRVSIYREMSPESVCRESIVPFAYPIPIDEAFNLNPDVRTFTSRYPAIEVNDYLGGIQFFIDDDVLIPSLSPAEREFITVTDVQVDTRDPQAVVLAVTADAPDGCPMPAALRVLPGTTPIQVQVYRPFFLLFDTCPAMLITHILTVQLDESFVDGSYDYVVNDVRGSFTVAAQDGGDDMPQGNRVPHVIESVEALVMESFPPQLSLQLSGYQPDGCMLEVQTVGSIDETTNTITVEVFREMPEDVVCTQNVVAYEGSIALGFFTPGTYTLRVNDYTDTLELE